MNGIRLQSGRWNVECLPEDGARISRLQFAGLDILTRAPESFQLPATDFGLYETRPVYGYDDCFPTVDSCRFPVGDNFEIPDHGELCWLPWKVTAEGNCLDCSVRSAILPVTFRRKMVFGESSLRWEFEVVNESGCEIPIFHVMHGLMSLDQVIIIELPECEGISDEINDKQLPHRSGEELSQWLLGRDQGVAEMLLLRKIKSGMACIGFQNGLFLQMEFSAELFPTFGIWWNNAGYPDEAGCRRTECAFEPIPGTKSSFEASYADGVHLSVPAEGQLGWTINWNIFN